MKEQKGITRLLKKQESRLLFYFIRVEALKLASVLFTSTALAIFSPFVVPAIKGFQTLSDLITFALSILP